MSIEDDFFLLKQKKNNKKSPPAPEILMSLFDDKLFSDDDKDLATFKKITGLDLAKKMKDKNFRKKASQLYKTYMDQYRGKEPRF